MKASRLLLYPAVLMLVAGSTLAATPLTDETFRADLTKFVDELSAIPSLEVDPAARSQVGAMGPEESATLRDGLSRVPNWQQLPAVLASVDQANREHDRVLLGRVLTAGSLGVPSETGRLGSDEDFRADFLFLVDQLERFAPLAGAEYGAKAMKLRGAVQRMDPATIVRLREAYAKRIADMIPLTPAGRMLRTTGSGPRPNETLGCYDDCGDIEIDCWIELVGCLIDAAFRITADIANFIFEFVQRIPQLIGQIASLPGTIVNTFTSLFSSINNFVTNTLNEITSLLPQDADDVLAYVLGNTGIDFANLASINWNSIAGSVPTITPPCPTGTALQTVADVCGTGANAITQLLYDVAPDDGLGLEFKIGVALVHFPLAYLCQCADIQATIDYTNAQAAHRNLTGQRLDLALSTRATQSSVNALSASLTNLDGDVARTETKTDQLNATANRIETNANRIEQTALRTQATVQRIETNVDRTEATTDRTETKVNALTQGNADQQTFLAEMSTLMTRLNIEENMLKARLDIISLFQLPSVFGGKLETVSLIVADTIAMNLAAGQPIFGAERELQRGDALRAAGDFVKAYEAYRSAYSEAVK